MYDNESYSKNSNSLCKGGIQVSVHKLAPLSGSLLKATSLATSHLSSIVLLMLAICVNSDTCHNPLYKKVKFAGS
jgi:hypothetical protein